MSVRLTLSWIPSLMIVVGLMFVSSCKDDEKPKSRFAFAESEVEVLEDDGTVELTINIDRAVSETVVLSYTLEGTATEFKAATGGDYEISPEGGNITIAPGATQAVVEIDLLPDGEFEYDEDAQASYETIILTLTSVVSGPGEIVAGEGTQVTVYVFEDDMLVFLDWDAGDGTTGDVDMDLLVWIDDPDDSPDNGFLFVNPANVGGGASEGTESEAVLLLSQLIDTDYGFSYVYFEGTADPLAFTVEFVNFGGTINGEGPEKTFEGAYALDNINRWADEGADAPIVVQTVTKSGRNYTDLSDIDEPETGSRMRTIIGNFGSIRKADAKGSLAQPIQTIKLPREMVQKWRGK